MRRRTRKAFEVSELDRIDSVKVPSILGDVRWSVGASWRIQPQERQLRFVFGPFFGSPEQCSCFVFATAEQVRKDKLQRTLV